MKGSARVLIAVAVIVGLGGLLAGPVRAGTIGPPQSVLSIRPYIAIGSPTGAAVYFQVDSTALCGTDSFRIAMSDAQGPQAFNVILAALLSDKKVELEASGDPCAWGMRIQSVTIVK